MFSRVRSCRRPEGYFASGCFRYFCSPPAAWDKTGGWSPLPKSSKGKVKTNHCGSFLAINQCLEARILFSSRGEAIIFSFCDGDGLLRSISPRVRALDWLAMMGNNEPGKCRYG